jgi:hypothetical protein
MPSSLARSRLLAVTAAVGTALALTAAAPAQADGNSVVARGLNSPRHLTVSHGNLYVVEAGRGGAGPCADHPEGMGNYCYGTTGAVTRVNVKGPDKKVITGLPSISNGSEALGPSDIVFDGASWVLSSGLGADPVFRNSFGKDGPLLATLLTGRLDRKGVKVFADVGANEALNNPDGTDHDSNPTGILKVGDSYYVADSGGNAVVKVSPNRTFSTLAVLPPAPTTKPGPVPVGFPADAVPTAVVQGPDGAFYISQLTGFPFEVGLSKIWRVVPGGQPEVWATGLTNVTDLAFGPGGKLYAVQIADKGLLDPAGPIGSLVQVAAHSSMPRTVAGGLASPYGVAFMDGSAYVSTCSVCTGGGEVMRVRL